MLREESSRERLVFRWCALAVAVAVLVGLAQAWRLSGADGLRVLASHAVLSLLFLGKFIVFSGLHEEMPSPWALALLVWLLDVVFALAMMSGLSSLERAPVLGRWLRIARGRAVTLIETYPGLERMAFVGVVFFVMLPLAATGAVTGSFAARLLGLSRIAGVVAIAIGSAGVSIAFATLAIFLGERAEDLARSPVLTGIAVVALMVAGRIGYLRVLGRLRAPVPRQSSPDSRL